MSESETQNAAATEGCAPLPCSGVDEAAKRIAKAIESLVGEAGGVLNTASVERKTAECIRLYVNPDLQVVRDFCDLYGHLWDTTGGRGMLSAESVAKYDEIHERMQTLLNKYTPNVSGEARTSAARELPLPHCSTSSFNDPEHSKEVDMPESTETQECPGWPEAERPEHGCGWPPSEQPVPTSHAQGSEKKNRQSDQCNTPSSDQ